MQEKALRKRTFAKQNQEKYFSCYFQTIWKISRLKSNLYHTTGSPLCTRVWGDCIIAALCSALIVHALVHCGAGMHSGFKWLKPTKNKFIQSDFTSFTWKFLQIYISNFRFRLPVLHNQNWSKCRKNKYNLSISQLFKILFLADFCYSAQLWYAI